MASAQVFHAVGKRKSAIARIYMKNGDGQILVNERPFEGFFPAHFHAIVKKPFDVLGVDAKYDVSVNVRGGGVSSQADACMYGIAKALVLVNDSNRPPLKKAHL